MPSEHFPLVFTSLRDISEHLKRRNQRKKMGTFWTEGGETICQEEMEPDRLGWDP